MEGCGSYEQQDVTVQMSISVRIKNTLSKVGESDERDNAADPSWFRSFSVFQGKQESSFCVCKVTALGELVYDT